MARRPVRPVDGHAVAVVGGRTGPLDVCAELINGIGHVDVIKVVGVGVDHGVEELGVLAGCDFVFADLVDVADGTIAGGAIRGHNLRVRRVSGVTNGDHVDGDSLRGGDSKKGQYEDDAQMCRLH